MKTPSEIANIEAQISAQENRKKDSQRRKDVLAVRKSLEEKIDQNKITSQGGKVCVDTYCLSDGLNAGEVSDLNNYLSKWGWTCDYRLDEWQDFSMSRGYSGPYPCHTFELSPLAKTALVKIGTTRYWR